MSAALLPVFLKLRGRPVLLVGGGRVALSKLEALLAAGAEVEVVSPEVHPEIVARAVRVSWRAFEPPDLEHAWYVVAAATPEVNRAVAAAAERQRVFVNAVDDQDNASAYLGAVVRRNGVTVAISTEGAAPGLAGLLREGVEALLPADVGEWTSLARRLRVQWRAAGVPMVWRRPLLLDALNRVYADREQLALEAQP